MAKTKKSKQAKPAKKKQPAKKQRKAAKKKKPVAKKSAAKKPAAKKPAAKKPAAKKPAAVPASDHLAKLAMTGNVDDIFALMDGDTAGDRDGLAYKWLVVAVDFGHEAAEDMMDDLLEASSLRYDDDQLVTGAAHWELGLAYLTGTEGLPRDLDKGRKQLEAALERGFPASIQEGDAEVVAARAAMTPDALAVFDAVFAGGSGGGLDDRGKEAEEDEGGEAGDDDEDEDD